MYDHILVPLDGSAISEKAVEHAVHMAENFGAELTLLRVVSLPDLPGVEVADIAQPLVAESKAYLRELARRLPTKHLTIHTAVYVGNAAATIIEHARKCGNAMVVMATHGHHRLEQWPLGSTAEKVLRSMQVPVLLVCAPQPAPVT